MSWSRFKEYCLQVPSLDLSLDISRVDFPDTYFAEMQPKIAKAIEDMEALEGGAIANPDENRMVGHYWLRNADIAPDKAISEEITATRAKIKDFAAKVHAGEIAGQDGPFKNLLCIGIGGSALGPQFVAQALGNPATDPMKVYFFDNTDPDGFDIVLEQLKGKLGSTLAIVTSKSGGTPETRNGMVEAQAAWKAAGLDFAKHAVAITGVDSKMDKVAVSEGWIERFPMWDWVGGRTSELAAVGLVPAALSGYDIDGMLDGAAAMDKVTREKNPRHNPAALLALMWYHLTGGRGAKDMVILPYKERLSLFAKYLQQLVMESLGKEEDLDGKRRPSGHRRLREQGLDRPARIRAATARGCPRTFTPPLSKCSSPARAIPYSSRVSTPPETFSRVSSWAPATLSMKTAATPSPSRSTRSRRLRSVC